MDGFGLYETGRTALRAVAHVQGIAVREVRREVAVVGDRNIRPFFAELDVVTVVMESMGEQTSRVFLAAADYCKQHRPPPHGSKISAFYRVEAVAVSGYDCGKMCIAVDD
jgi:hypothetical protein